MPEIVWEGEFEDVSCRIVHLGENKVIVERKGRDAMGEPYWCVWAVDDFSALLTLALIENA